MLEHMRSENYFTGIIFDLLNPLTVRIIGANVNSNAIKSIAKAGLKLKTKLPYHINYEETINIEKQVNPL